MFPLLGHAFGINICVPNHQGRHQWIGHLSAGEGNIAETFVAEVSLPDVDAVAVFGRWTIERCAGASRSSCSTGGIVGKGHISRTWVRARFQADAKEPVVGQGSA